MVQLWGLVATKSETLRLYYTCVHMYVTALKPSMILFIHCLRKGRAGASERAGAWSTADVTISPLSLCTVWLLIGSNLIVVAANVAYYG